MASAFYACVCEVLGGDHADDRHAELLADAMMASSFLELPVPTLLSYPHLLVA